MTSPSPTATSPSFALLTAALSGAAVIIIELSAVRLLAPWFGTSLVVWSNVIGVVLLGLALGYLIGARLSQGEAPVRSLRWVLGVAVAWVALIPFLAPHAAGALTPETLNLDRALAVFRWGSLAASGLLFLGPAVVLGCVGPLVTEALGRYRGLNPGDAGGRVLFGSTLGSLAGVFATSWYLVPTLGLRGTYLVAALVLVLALGASLLAWRGRPAGSPAAALALIGLTALALPSELQAASPDQTVLELVESPYQRVRVVEIAAPEPEGVVTRFLQVNEASNSYQSAWQPEPGLLDGSFYFNDFVLPYFWQAERPDTWRVLCIGLGAGTAKRVLEGELEPLGVDVRFFGVELDPAVVELAERWCGLEVGPGDRVLAGVDGRAALAGAAGPFDQIIVDAYANQFEIPPHLVTREFFEALDARLAPGGWIQLNVGGAAPQAALPSAVAGTLATALDASVLTLEVPGTHNQVLTAQRGGALPNPTGPAFRPADLPAGVRALLTGREVRGLWSWTTAAGPHDLILTDDDAPVEALLFGKL